eukprot:TRINITY_DN10858_c0_g1_i1.p1 TRINITY_DN10858_c0_g1~~TRINITY_DN10858_c0_g1_i1.p1  ORF type:complete len:207 (+),score=30.32 TRINITY_DN10858_c0_g1_i1:31-651(+)
MAFLGRFFRWWSKNLDERPYTTQILTNGPLWASADAICQKFAEKREEIDWARTARMGAYGYFVAGPLFSWWYTYLERIAAPVLWKRGMMPYIALKIGLDQLVFEPPYLLAFFGIMNISEGKSWEDYKTTIKTEYAHTFALDCAVWPAAQYLNFRYVPTRFHALYVNAISLGWASFLSFVAHRGDANSTQKIKAVASTETVTSTSEK